VGLEVVEAGGNNGGDSCCIVAIVGENDVVGGEVEGSRTIVPSMPDSSRCSMME